MITRLQLSATSPNGDVPHTSFTGLDPASHGEWLATLKRGDMVRIRNGDLHMPPAMVTNETPCYVFVGKLKFWRRHGWQVMRQGKRVYRMKLRLVRDEKEFT
jgi:hypothetical protein